LVSDILSQEEIDALLAALSRGEVDADSLRQEQTKKKIRLYDFRRPNKFSKDQLHTLQVIFENYSRSVSTYLSAQLRAAVQIDVLSVEQLTYDEFMRSLPNPTIMCVFSLQPLEGSAIMEINPNLGFAMLDRILGGPGLPPERIRPLTEIEITLIERLAQRMLSYLEEPWSGIIELQPVMDRIESNPQFTQIVSPSEMVVIISLESKIGDVLSLINICIPFLVLESITGKLNVNYYYSSSVKERSKDSALVLKNRIENAMVPVKILIGSTVITVRELLELAPGDVIPLERRLDEDFEVVIGQKPKFRGKPGVVGNRLALKITEIVSEVDDDA